MATTETRRGRDGKLVYRVKVRRRGQPNQTATFKRKTDADNWAKIQEVAILEGRHFKASEAKKHTVAEAIDRYLRDTPKSRDARDRQRQLTWWREQLGRYTLADLTPARIASARDQLARGQTIRSKTRSPATVKRYLAALSRLCTVATNDWGWLDDSPMRKVTKPKEPPGRTRFLSDDERDRLLKACKTSTSPCLHIVVVLALATGMRRGEIMGLRWRDVDLNRRRITVEHSKNGERRSLAVSGLALSLLIHRSALSHSPDDLLFPGKRTSVDLKKSWSTAVKKAELRDFRFHDLRHSTASCLAMQGATPSELAEILGHKTLAMVKRYAHFTESHTDGLLERMNGKVFAHE